MDTEKPHPLREIRQAIGWDQQRFAGFLGVTPAHLSQIERGNIHSLGRKVRRGLTKTHRPGDIVALEEAIREWNTWRQRHLAAEAKAAFRELRGQTDDGTCEETLD